MTNVIKFPRKWEGEKNQRHFEARPHISERTKGRCSMCGRRTRRSWRTGVLHGRCFTCRYLVMVYGPNIKVTYIGDSR